MATFTQIYTMVNDAAKEALGEQAITVKDTSSLVSLGEQVVSSDETKDIFTKTLVDKIARTVVAIREYNPKHRSVKRDLVNWGLFVQKISYKKKEAVENPSYDFATQANPFDVEPSTEVIQKLFGKISTWSYEDVIPDNQMFTAFDSAAQFGAFVSGIYTNINNSYALAEENIENLAVNTYMAGVIKKGKATQKRNLLAEYNTKHTGNELTVDSCLTSADFLKYASREINTVIGNMKKMSVLYNVEDIPRHTPADMMVVEILGQFASATASYLESDTYHKELVSLPNYEEVAYWQAPGKDFAFENVSKIDIKNTDIDAAEISQSGIIAFVHDYDAVACYIDKPRQSSIYNPRAERTNVFYKATQGYGADLSENGVVFYIAA